MSMLAIAGFARRFWPIIWPILLAAFVIGAAWIWGNSREATGRSDERAKWQQVAAAQALEAAAQAARQQAAVAAANDAATAAQARLDALAARSKESARVYYKDRPAVACLSDERLRAISEADAAATAASTPE
jgi:multidrug efflux pump subunit AcrA (membrane-fusion protein)